MPSPDNTDEDHGALPSRPGARPQVSVMRTDGDAQLLVAPVGAWRGRRETVDVAASRQALIAALDRVARGDREAFAFVYEATSLKLYGTVSRILGRSAVADEVLQEVFVRVWQRAGDFDPAAGSPITWMAAIARNLALDEARRKTARSIEDFPEILRLPGSDDPSARQEQSEEFDRLAACLDRLQPERKQLVLLAYHYGMTRQEISARLDRPAATVKTWLRRSLAQLKDCMGR